jgi:hypothetical protein
MKSKLLKLAFAGILSVPFFAANASAETQVISTTGTVLPLTSLAFIPLAGLRL